MIRLEVFDYEMQRLGAINQFSSISYEEEFADVGSFQLVCPINEENIGLIAKNRIIWFEDDVAGFIQYMDKTGDEESQYAMIVKGTLLSETLKRRWVYPVFLKEANPIVLMEDLVALHCINPSDKKRQIPLMQIKHNNMHLPSVLYRKTGGSIVDSLQNISNSTEVGFRVGFNPRIQKPFIFEAYKGKDLTLGNEEGNIPVFFSHKMNNIANGEYIYNDTDYKNVSLVAGENADGTQDEDETKSRRILEVKTEDVSGLYRRELYVDARDLQSEYSEDVKSKDEDGNEVTTSETKKMTDEQYNSSLLQRGNEKLGECPIEESYSSQIVTASGTMFKYKEDYNLGDKVSVYDEELRITINAMVTAMTTTVDENGRTYEPTFGYGLPTIMAKVRRGW